MGVLFRKKSGPQQQQQQQQQERLVFFPADFRRVGTELHLHPTKIWGLDQLILEDTKEEVASNFSVQPRGGTEQNSSQCETHPRTFFKTSIKKHHL